MTQRKNHTKLKKEKDKISKPNIPKGNLEQALDVFNENTALSKSSRRDFLKLCGYSLAIGTVVASCENSVQKAIPYLVKPEEITPGKANYYASSYVNGSEYCSILIKTREGRPIKIEGNDLSGVTHGGTNARVQASVLDLYDTSRYKHPVSNNKKISWEDLDKLIISELEKLKKEYPSIALRSSSGFKTPTAAALVTPTIFSPSTKKLIKSFIEKYPQIKWFQYDNDSADALKRSNTECFAEHGISDYRFDNADLIVSFDADFLGNWLSPIEHIRQYTKKRKLSEGSASMSEHIQFESRMTLTGSNADRRIPVKPSEQPMLVAQLYNEILKIKGKDTYELPSASQEISTLAKELWSNKGKSLVVAGENDLDMQVLINAINFELGNYGTTIRLDQQLQTKQAYDMEMENLLEDMQAGNIKALFCCGVNPVYDYYRGDDFAKALQETPFSVSLDEKPNETSALCKHVAPVNHYLESWGDFEPKTRHYSLMQPGIRPLFDTRQLQNSLLAWMAQEPDYLKYIQDYWEKKLYPSQNAFPNFASFWKHTLQKGVFEQATKPPSYWAHIQQKGFFEPAIQSKLNAKINTRVIEQTVSKISPGANSLGIELQVYEPVVMGDGSMANNPWLQELPDPVTKVCWDNYLSISPKQANEMQLQTGDVVEINSELELPVYVLPGQAYNTTAVALGYGRKVCGTVGKDVGQNVARLIRMKDEARLSFITDVRLKKTGKKYELAMTQSHHSMEGRAIVREANLKEYQKNPAAGNEDHHKFENANIYEKPTFPNHHWGVVVDLNSCVGCGACSIACQAENNVPVVGKKEVIRGHEMSWIRIDRYFSGDEDNPAVSFQPVMCQHCDNAPCENVCPVAATNRSSEGLNQMAYNRCIGTRYCNNNCPYKVRRFNWYDYTNADTIRNNLHDIAGMTLDLKRMVQNPDVTVRAKGVIEKCSLCVQRIQEGKLNAKLESRKLKDGEIKTACQQACPAGAIIFGDLNDNNGELAKEIAGKRNYHLLEEIHTLPSVSYLTKIRNKT